MISRNVEDYLKAIYEEERRSEKVTNGALADRMNVSMASVTKMMKRLASMQLVEHVPYQGVHLTTKGRRVALEVIRHHRLLELFLSEHLGMAWDKVHDEAERLEHALSEELEAAIDRALGYPTHDPHGHPIPSADLHVEEDSYPALCDMQAGETGVVRRVDDDDAGHLRRLVEQGVGLGSKITLLERSASKDKSGDLLTLQVKGGEQLELSCEDACRIFVEMNGGPSDEK